MTHWQRSSTHCHKYTNCQFSTQHKGLHSCSTFSYSEVNSPTIYSSPVSSHSPTIYSSPVSSDSSTIHSSPVSSVPPSTAGLCPQSHHLQQACVLSPTIYSRPVSSDSPTSTAALCPQSRHLQQACVL